MVKKLLTAAKREVEEETNLKIVNDIYFLASKKVTNKKLAVMFYSIMMEIFLTLKVIHFN